LGRGVQYASGTPGSYCWGGVSTLY
jgi:hypothetical protein